MTFVVLFILAVLWALYLASWARNRTTVRRGNSISSFNRHLSVLGKTQPGAPSAQPTTESVTAEQANIGSFSSLAPAERDPMVRPPAIRGLAGGAPITQRDAQRRRRDILFGLVAVTATVTVGAFMVGGPVLWLALIGWGAVGCYVLMLARSRQIAAENEAKVHYLQPVGQVPAPAPELRLDEYGYDIDVEPEIYLDESGYAVDRHGRPCDEYGRMVDEYGSVIVADESHGHPQAHSYA